ncbi:VWA domain-containing protein [Nocardioides sp. dk4132]|uniref:vWA domain-containing protein n=1 Tax=unclassified Nocardioides TaxID=2615069 RepID=UPI0012954B6A|nr:MULTISPECIES: VWA domain-containing protein [unclassified Nocardioides]MQW76336.1 VWA domain-containing protein [Nocardioides sp. dk4132]QGA07384.1 VWA domain-containing protein [Nocardioides sp. dk884]
MKLRRHLAGLAAILVATSAGAVVATAPAPSHAAPAASSAAEPDGYGRMMLLLDASGSMSEPAGGGQTKIAAARKALTTVVEGLPDEAQVGLRVFGATVFSRTDKGSCTDSQVVVEPGTDNRDALRAAIGDYEPYGETPIPHALEEAAKDLGDEGTRSIVLVSDGESTCDPDPCTVAAELQKNGIDLQIDVVGLSVSGAARSQLQCIAEKGNGTYYDADSAADIESRLTRVASRALRPFTLSGAPIVGGAESSPTPVEVGEYVDTLGAAGESTSYVFTRETAGTTLRVAALSQGETGFMDGLIAEVTGPAGRCDYASANRTALDLREVMGVQVTAGAGLGSSGVEGCEEPGDYVVTITRARGASEEVPFGLVVTEEPPVEEVGFSDPELASLSATAPQVGGQPQRVEGASSFDGAPEVGTGSWSSTVVPGEVLIYKVPLEFGQAAQVSVNFPEATGQLSEQFGRFAPSANLTLFNPLGAQLGYVDGSTWLGSPDGVSLQAAVPAVSRAPSEVRSAKFNGGADVTVAGDYYVSLSVQKRDYTVEIPFTLDVEVIGEPADGPTYAGGATWNVVDGATAATEDPSAGTSETESAEADGDGEAAAESEGDTVSIVAVAAGVLGLAALVAALLLWRRRSAG